MFLERTYNAFKFTALPIRNVKYRVAQRIFLLLVRIKRYTLRLRNFKLLRGSIISPSFLVFCFGLYHGGKGNSTSDFQTSERFEARNRRDSFGGFIGAKTRRTSPSIQKQ